MQFAEDDCTVTRAVATLVQSSNISPYGIRRRFALHELALAERSAIASIRSMSLTNLEMEKSLGCPARRAEIVGSM
jgi:hypothetical protein